MAGSGPDTTPLMIMTVHPPARATPYPPTYHPTHPPPSRELDATDIPPGTDVGPVEYTAPTPGHRQPTAPRSDQLCCGPDTKTGLTIQAALDTNTYQRDIKIIDKEMRPSSRLTATTRPPRQLELHRDNQPERRHDTPETGEVISV